MKKTFLVVLMLFLLTGCFGNEQEENNEQPLEETPTEIVEGETINVPGDYETIGEAISAANHGDEIIVAEGVYNENINFNGKNIKLTSSDPTNDEVVANTIITGLGNGPVVRIDSGEGEQAVLTGFTITGGNYDHGGGINIGPQVSLTSPTITYNVFEGNQSNYGGAIYAHQSRAVIENNIFRNNSANNGGGAIYTSSNGDIIIRNNTFDSNHGGNFGGAINVVLSSPTITDNIFSNNEADFAGGAISVGTDGNPTIENNEYFDNLPDDEDL